MAVGFLLETGKSCLKAREKVNRRGSDGIRAFDIVKANRWSIDGQSNVGHQKVPWTMEHLDRSSKWVSVSCSAS
jgi:hypothetical protein